MVHPEDRDLVREHVAKLLNGQPVPPVEHRIYHKNGSVRWVRATMIAHYGDHGQLVRYDGLVEDITERKRVDHRLWQILESAPDAMVITDREGRILLANGQAHRLFGFARRELIHKQVEILIPERYRADHVKYREQFFYLPSNCLVTGRPELYGLRKDGSEFAAEICLSPIEMDDEVLVCAGIRDISHRRQIERALRINLQSQATLSGLLKLSLEPFDLVEKLERSLDLLFSVPWIELQSKGAVLLLSEETHTLSLVAQRGLSSSLLDACRSVAVGQGLCGRAAAARDIVFSDGVDACHETRHQTPGAGMTSHGHYCVPIVSGEHLLGVLDLYVVEGHRRSDEQDQFLQAASHVLAGIITRSRAEDSLQESEERFDLAVRGSDAGIWDWNLATNEVYFSPRWKGMLGFGEKEIGNHFAEWETRLHPDDRQRSIETIQAYLDGKTPQYELEHRLQHRDGSYRWILARGALVRECPRTPLSNGRFSSGYHGPQIGRRAAPHSRGATDRSATDSKTSAPQLLAEHPWLRYRRPRSSCSVCRWRLLRLSDAARRHVGDRRGRCEWS